MKPNNQEDDFSFDLNDFVEDYERVEKAHEEFEEE